MIDTIKEHLDQLEKDKNITILLAVESGSRAWGIPSPDSDYDVRIIYKHKEDWYLSIEDRKDSIDYFHGDELDISGWDIRKTLKLVRKSNATPMEWCLSPIIYKEVQGFKESLLLICSEYFIPRHAVNHYWGIAKNTYHTSLTDGTIKVKKLFYILRPLLAAKWIIDNNELPPTDIPTLLNSINNVEILKIVEELIQEKDKAKERILYTLDPELHKYISNLFEYVKTAEILESSKHQDSTVLNHFFRDTIKNY